MPKKLPPVNRGDCVDSIAYDNRVRSDAVWNDAANQSIKDARKDRNVLMPGVDELTIPDPEIKWHTGRKTSLTHIFKRELPTKEFRFQVLLGNALTAFTYKLEIDGTDLTAKAKFDADWVTCQIPPNAKEAVITLSYTLGRVQKNAVLKERKYTIKLGHLRPLDSPQGQEDRLRNLGFYAPLPDGKTPTLDQALRLFQTSHGIDPADTNAAELTIDKLKELTGDPV